MTLFYEPKTRKAKIWPVIVIIGVPLLIFAAVFVFGKQRVAFNAQHEQNTPPEDIFKKF